MTISFANLQRLIYSAAVCNFITVDKRWPDHIHEVVWRCEKQESLFEKLTGVGRFSYCVYVGKSGPIVGARKWQKE